MKETISRDKTRCVNSIIVTTPILQSILSSWLFQTSRTHWMKVFSQANNLIVRIFDRISVIRQVRLSLFFICCSCMCFKTCTITEMNDIRNYLQHLKVFSHVLRGMDKTIIPTPTNAAQPRRSYRETNASMIYREFSTTWKIKKNKKKNLKYKPELALKWSSNHRYKSLEVG